MAFVLVFKYVKHDEFKSIAYVTPSCGVRLWNDAPLPVTRGAWNNISMYIKLNTPGKYDGVVQLTVNGETRRYSKMRWRDNASLQFNYICFTTFFGGGVIAWFAPKSASYTKFRNFSATYNE